MSVATAAAEAVATIGQHIQAETDGSNQHGKGPAIFLHRYQGMYYCQVSTFTSTCLPASWLHFKLFASGIATLKDLPDCSTMVCR